MKKIIFSSLLLAFVTLANAQSKRDSLLIGEGLSKDLLGNNEIKFNFLFTVIGLPEFSYERIITDDMAVGISLFVPISNLADYRYGVVPYYRYYFGERKASGFFIEGHAAMIGYHPSGGKTAYDIDSFGNSFPVLATRKTVFGLGAAAGFKFLTRKGFIGEIYLGASQTYNKLVDVFPRAGLILGKRF